MIRRKGNKKAWILLLVMLALFCAGIPRERAAATSTTISGRKLEIMEIDYDAETITVRSNNKDTCLYYSDAKQKTWECAHGTFDEVTGGTPATSYRKYVLDISWIIKTKDYVLTLKGDQSDTVLSVTLPKQQTNFKVTLDYTTQTFNYTNYQNKQVEVYWRKNNSTKWEKVDSYTYSIIQRFYARGVTLYFRVGQVKGTSATEVGSRPSKEVKLSIVKQAAAPSVTITPSTQVLTLSALLQYRPYGSSGEWTTASSKKLSIPNEVAKNAYISNENSTPSDVVLEFRTAATAKKPASMEKTITIKAQENAPTTDVVKIKVASVSGASDDSNTTQTSTLSLEIEGITEKNANGEEVVKVEGASSSNPYEYTIVTPGKELDLTNAVWKAVTASKATISKVEPNTKIYVRKKAHVSSEDKTVYYPESISAYYVVGKYTRNPSKVRLRLDGDKEKETIYTYKKDEKIILAKEAGVVIDKENSEYKFQITTAKATDEDGKEVDTTKLTVSSILCNNIALEFDQVTDEDGVITVTIISTDKAEASLTGNAAYPVTITLSNGEVINDSVMLDILKKGYLQQGGSFTLIEGVSKEAEYTFDIVSTKKLGTTKGEYEFAEIASIVIMNGESPITIPKEDYTVNLSKDSGVITVTLTGEKLEKHRNSLTKNKEYTLAITLKDNEEEGKQTKITSGVTLTYTQEAETIQSETGWTTYYKRKSEALEKNLEIKMRYRSEGVWISNVTVEKKDNTGTPYTIAGNSYMDSEYVYIVLSKNQINEFTGNGEYRVYVYFSNGAKVDTGCVINFAP